MTTESGPDVENSDSETNASRDNRVDLTDVDQKLEDSQKALGYTFNDIELLRCALTHASGADHRLNSNERLEFLGDAVLGFVVCEHVFREFPKLLEGDLTKIKSVVVSRESCAKFSDDLGLRKYMILGKGMAASPEIPPSLMADVFEAAIAAIYLDGGLEAAAEFVHRFVDPMIQEAASGDADANFKSQLQQLAQRDFHATPIYRLLDEQGPDHEKCFKVSAQIGETRYEAAWGRNKKEAEQRAARNALSQIRDKQE